MNHRTFVEALASTLLLATAAHPEGVAIDHRAVGCVVAGKFPRLNACFAPSSQLARARVYFRVADASAEWYYVEMKSDAPCFAGVLPKPKQQLVGHKLQYYVNAVDRAFAEARTDEAEARIVAKAADCDSKAVVAPLLNSAAVVVFPGMPAGFAAAAGLGVGATAAIVGGGVALAGGGVAIAASQSGSSSSGGSSSGGPTTTLPPDTFPPTTTTTTTTTTTLIGFDPVIKVFQAGVPVDISKPITGSDPLVLDVDMCASVGPYPLRYVVEVDGVRVGDKCRSSYSFTMAGVTAKERGPVRAAVSSRSFALRVGVYSVASNNDPKSYHKTTVQVDAKPCATDKTGPAVRLTQPPADSVYPRVPYPVHMESVADDTSTGNNGVASVEYKINYPGPTQAVLGPVSTSPYAVDWTQAQVEQWLGTSCFSTASIQAYAVDNCGNPTLSSAVAVTVYASTPNCIGFRAASSEATSSWLSELAVSGGSGQVVVNGEAVFPRAGRSPIPVRLRRGENRVEATLVEARSGGSWRFELGGGTRVRPDSIRVVAGDVMQSGADALVFRLQGRPGERIVFSFVVE